MDWAQVLAGIVAVILVALLVLGLARSQFHRVTVYEYQQGMRYRNGQYVGLAGPGPHWIYRSTTFIRIIDTRVTLVDIPGQEIVTSDGVSVKMSLAVQQRLVDPVVAYHEVENYLFAAYSVVQVALRETVGALSIDDVLARRDEIGTDVLKRALEPARALGVEVIAVDVKDLMLGPATKRLFAQVIEARQRGLASLEKARGETAALRSLANAARLVEANPALLQLRLLEQLDSSSGNTIVLGMPPVGVPLPVRNAALRRSAESRETTEDT